MNKQGFIYTSMLIGLMLLASMMALFYPVISTKSSKLDLQTDVKTINSIIDQARLCALTSGWSKLNFSKQGIVYECGLIKHDYTFKSSIDTNFPENKLTFNDRGHVNRAGTINVTNGINKKKILVHIGAGL